jgi:cobalt-zinc-cadmium efflux system outer membrane protein
MRNAYRPYLFFPLLNIKLRLSCFSLLIPVFLSFGQSDSAILKSNTAVFNSILDSILKETVAMNPNLKATGYKAEASNAAVGTIRLDPPLVAVEFYQTPIKSFPNPFKNQMEVDYSLQQEIPFPGKLRAMADAERNRSKMLGAEQQTTRQEIIRLTKTAFYELYLTDRLFEINSSSQFLIRNFIAISKKQYELGMGRQTDILRAQTELSKLINDSIALFQSRQSAVAMINSYRNKPIETSIDIIPEILVQLIPLEAVDSLLAVAEKNRPELNSMQFNIAMASSELSSAKKEYYPDFMVRGMYKQMIHEPDDWSLMLGFTLPVAPWSIGRYSAAVSRSNALVKQSQSEYENMRNMVASQVKDALAKVWSSQAQFDLIKNTTIPQARQTMQSALSGYQSGKGDFLMVIDTQRMLLMAQQDYHMAVMRAISNRANLERAIGVLK